MKGESERGLLFDGRDVTALLGLGLLAGGFYFIYWPLALIVPGALLTHKALYGVSGQARNKERLEHDQ